METFDYEAAAIELAKTYRQGLITYEDFLDELQEIDVTAPTALELLGDYPLCEQRSSHLGYRAPAEVYAIDPIPGGWGGKYCQACADKLGFQVVDVL